MNASHHSCFFLKASDRVQANVSEGGSVGLTVPEGGDYLHVTFDVAHIPALKALVALLEQQAAETKERAA